MTLAIYLAANGLIALILLAANIFIMFNELMFPKDKSEKRKHQVTIHDAWCNGEVNTLSHMASCFYCQTKLILVDNKNIIK